MIRVASPDITDLEINAAVEVLRSGHYVSGKQVQAFEGEFAEMVGTKYAVAVNSGTAALDLAIKSLNIEPSSEIIVPPMTFFATIAAVLHNDCVPVFCDVNDEYTMDPDKIEGLITESTKAILPVHLFGMPCDMDKINEIAGKFNLLVIEDAAQAHGAAINSKKVGSFGNVGCFSTYSTKNLCTIEGGMITTDNWNVAKRCRLFRNHGMSDPSTHIVAGYNYRLDEVRAAIGRVQLKRLEDMNRIRRANSATILSKIVGAKMPHVTSRPFWVDLTHAYFWCPIYVKKNPRGFKRELLKKGIETRYRYTKPLYRQPCLDESYHKLRLPNAEKYAGYVMGLPNHTKLTEDEVKYIADTVIELGGDW